MHHRHGSVYNPDAFKGRYPKTKRWLAEHPGYLQRYRAEHPEYEAKDNARRAERRLLQKMLAVPAPERGAVPSNDLNKDGADIQDAMTVSGNGNGNENGAAKGVHLKAGTNGNGKENENGIGNDNGGRYTRRDNAEGR